MYFYQRVIFNNFMKNNRIMKNNNCICVKILQIKQSHTQLNLRVQFMQTFI